MDTEEFDRRVNIVVNDCNGIQPQTNEFYKISIQYSAQQSRGSFIHFEDLLKYDADLSDIFGSLQEALTHAAGLSKFFKPATRSKSTKALAKARARNLKRQFDIQDHDPLLDRRLRDTMEHYDEKLDTYLLKHDAGYFFPTPLVDDYSLNDKPTGKLFKLVDPKAEKCVILGQVFDYAGIRKSVERISDMITAI